MKPAKWIPFIFFLVACGAPPSGFREGSPADHLPPHITRFTGRLDGGLRPAWHQSGLRFLYLNGIVGDLFEFDIETGRSRPLTSHFDHFGFTRAHYLSNGCSPSAGFGLHRLLS